MDIKFTKHLKKNAWFFLGSIHLQNRKIVWDSEHKLGYDIPGRSLSHYRNSILQ